MSFKILIETGDPDSPYETIHEIDDRRITRVGMTTGTGEVGAARINPDQTEVLLTFEHAVVDGRPTLADVETMLHPTRTGEEAEARISELKELPTATNTGGRVFAGIVPEGVEPEKVGVGTAAKSKSQSSSGKSDSTKVVNGK